MAECDLCVAGKCVVCGAKNARGVSLLCVELSHSPKNRMLVFKMNLKYGTLFDKLYKDFL